MVKYLLTSFLFLLFFQGNARAQIISLGKFSIGRSRINADLKDFEIHSKHDDVVASWVPDSVQWIRDEQNLLVPRALLKISVRNNNSLISINYRNKVIIPVKNKNFDSTEIYVDLFSPEIFLIYSGESLLDKIIIEPKSVANAKSRQLIDYSCSPYNLKIEGIDEKYISVGCKMTHTGQFGNEQPRLEITLTSTNLKTLDNAKPPYTIYLKKSAPVELKMKGIDEKINVFRLEATLPERLYRFKTAFGLGPYIYQSNYLDNKKISSIAPSLMIYGKFDLTETSSIKAFDALLYSKSFFNNSGLYFSYDLAELLDGRVLVNTLLGFQGLHYKYASDSPTIFRLIYPQGFEILYKHAFIENYNLFYGMFFSTSSEKYTNAWIRYGKKSFIELNYIGWGNDRGHIKMWGLSMGFPLFSAF